MEQVFPSSWYSQFAPITTAIGFLDAPFSDIIEADQTWRNTQGMYSFRRLMKPPSQQLQALLPLTGPLTRYIWTRTHEKWTAYFDNFCNGGDPYGSIFVLSGMLRCRGAIVMYVPQLLHNYGGVRFDVYDGKTQPTSDPLIRTVAAIHDGGQWDWTEYGQSLSFEQLENYKRRKVRERLTLRTLLDYAQALEIDPYNEAFYASEGVLVVNREIRHVERTESLTEYQTRMFQK
jgi:hypothetical protein